MVRSQLVRSRADLTVAAALMAAALVPSNAVAAPQAPFLPAGERADAPEGFLAMCRRDAALCSAGHAVPRTGKLSAISARAGADHDADGCARNAGAPATDGLVSIRFVPGEPASPSVSACRQGSSRPSPQPRLVTAALDRSPAAAPTDPSAGLSDAEPLAEKRLIRRINARVNGAVRQLPDTVTAGIDEYWQRPTPGPELRGDCEDIAIEKRAQLLEAGFPADRLFFAVAYRRHFGLHTVLIARLADGDYVLDSLSPAVRLWARVQYSWLRQQSPTDPMRWSRIGGRRADTQVAAAGSATTPL